MQSSVPSLHIGGNRLGPLVNTLSPLPTMYLHRSLGTVAAVGGTEIVRTLLGNSNPIRKHYAGEWGLGSRLLDWSDNTYD